MLSLGMGETTEEKQAVGVQYDSHCSYSRIRSCVNDPDIPDRVHLGSARMPGVAWNRRLRKQIEVSSGGENNQMIKKVILDYFKGVRHAEYEFGNKTFIYGRNGSGKTTILDAIMDLFADKDYNLRSNPEIHSDFAEESEPSMTVIWETKDGKEVELRKFQKDVRTKKQIEAGAPVRISNCYEINSVPKSQKDFYAYLEDELGIDLVRFLMFTHPEEYTSHKSADCRKTLFDMVSDLTDKDIVAQMSECSDLAEMLETYTTDEVAALMKRQKKSADDGIEAIPNQIIGLEKAKVDADTSELDASHASLSEKIASIEETVREMRIPSIGELNQRLVILEKQEKQLVTDANIDRVATLTELNTVIGDMRMKLKRLEMGRDQIATALSNGMQKKKALEQEYFDLSKRYQDLKNSEFNPSSKCPYCGQDMPVHEIDKAAKKFEADKKKRMDTVNEDARDIKNQYNKLIENLKSHEIDLKETTAEIEALQKDIDAKSKEREKYEVVISVTGTPEHSKLLSEIAKVHHKINQRDAILEQEKTTQTELALLKQELRGVDDQLAQVKGNDRIDAQIAELKTKQREYAQSKADAERILDQLSALSMRKNSLLEEEVNSHFTRVKFRLFVTQKNGEVRDDCTPMVLTKDGEYRDMTFSANTAAIVLAQLDIIKGLQEFYGQDLPVLLDGAECLDEESLSQIDIGRQLIATFVTDGDLEVKHD